MNQEFTFHILNEDGKAKAVMVAEIFDDCLEKLKILCPEGRQFSICKTKLEEACFFAKKAMASSADNHQ